MAINKVIFGVIGTNIIVDTVLEAARLDNRFECCAIYSRTAERAAEFALKHNIGNTFTSLEDMASSDLIDAVYIASPNSCHASQSIMFMENGKHVLCEKPLASNAHEAQLMIAASKRYGVTLMEAMKPTLTPDFAAVINNIGKIGKIRRYFSSYCQYSSRYDKLKEGIVLNAFNPDLSNGAMMDIGIYTLYPMVVLFGRPKRIQASGLLLHTGVDGQGAVNFEYEGMNATILYSKIADSMLPTEIQGEDGMISLDRINGIRHVMLNYRKGGSLDLSCHDRMNDYTYEISEFINLIQAGKTESAINSHRNSVLVMEIIDEIRRQLGVVYPADKY